MTKDTDEFDLHALNTIVACNKPAEIEIKHPVSGVRIGVFISIVGKDGDAYRGRVRAMADDSLRRSATGNRGSGEQTIDALEQKNIDALVAATTGWRTETPKKDDKGEVVRNDKGEVVKESAPVLKLNGERLDFSVANARRVYAEILPIREQVSEEINNLGNFMPA